MRLDLIAARVVTRGYHPRFRRSEGVVTRGYRENGAQKFYERDGSGRVEIPPFWSYGGMWPGGHSVSRESIICVETDSLLNMNSPRVSEPLNLRVSTDIRGRLDHLAGRYDLTITSISRIALVIGLEALEDLQAKVSALPEDSGSTQ